MIYRWLADAVLTVHISYVVYLLVGGYLAWRWQWTIVGHVTAAVWGLGSIALHWECPLTTAQNALRQRGGLPPLRDGFVNTYLRGTVFPTGHDKAIDAAIAVVIVTSWVGFVVLWRRRRGGASPGLPRPLRWSLLRPGPPALRSAALSVPSGSPGSPSPAGAPRPATPNPGSPPPDGRRG